MLVDGLLPHSPTCVLKIPVAKERSFGNQIELSETTIFLPPSIRFYRIILPNSSSEDAIAII